MEGVTIRRATPADKQSVIDIRDDVYDGRDYLPSYYDNLMASEHHIAFVAEVDGKVVSFCAGFLIDDGQTVVTRAGRVSRDYSGGGIYKMLQSHLLTESGVKVNAFSVSDANPVVDKPTFLKKYRHVVSRPFFKYVFKPKEVSLPNSIQKLSTVNEKILGKYLTEDMYKKYLFPEDRIIVDLVPFQLKKSNVKLIQEIGSDVKIFSNIRTDSGCIAGVLILSCVYTSDDTDFYFVGVYGTDMSAFREGIADYLDMIIKTTSKYIDLIVFFGANIDATALEATMNGLGLHKLTWIDPETGRSYSKVIIFEKDIV